MDFGWALAKYAWGLARRNRTLLALGFPAGLFLGAASLINLALTAPAHGFTPMAVVLLAGFTFAAVFLQTALAFAADAAIDGDDLGWRDALAEARWRLGSVIGWAAILAAVAVAGDLLVRIERLEMVVWLLTAGWSFLAFLVVPAIAVDLATPGEALHEARELLRDRWGEQFAGLFGIGAVTALAAIPVAILIGAGASRNDADPGSGTLPIVLGAVLGIGVLGLATATFQSFAVALHRDATVGMPGALAFVERRPKRKSWVVRIGIVILVGLLTLGTIGSLVGPRPQPKEFQTHFPVRYAAAITAGMPVVYEGTQVGEVKRSEISGDEDRVWFTVDDDYRSLQDSTTITITMFEGRPCLAIVEPGQAPSPATIPADGISPA